MLTIDKARRRSRALVGATPVGKISFISEKDPAISSFDSGNAISDFAGVLKKDDLRSQTILPFNPQVLTTPEVAQRDAAISAIGAINQAVLRSDPASNAANAAIQVANNIVNPAINPAVDAALGAVNAINAPKSLPSNFRDYVRGIFGKDVPITQAYGNYNPAVEQGNGINYGVDLGAPYGSPIKSPLSGKVVQEYTDPDNKGYIGDTAGHLGYGNSLLVDYGEGRQARYSHLSNKNFKVGDKIEAGQIIGNVGASGNVTGTHLDNEFLLNGRPVPYSEFVKSFSGQGGGKPAETLGQVSQADFLNALSNGDATTLYQTDFNGNLELKPDIRDEIILYKRAIEETPVNLRAPENRGNIINKADDFITNLYNKVRGVGRSVNKVFTGKEELAPFLKNLDAQLLVKGAIESLSPKDKTTGELLEEKNKKDVNPLDDVLKVRKENTSTPDTPKEPTPIQKVETLINQEKTNLPQVTVPTNDFGKSVGLDKTADTILASAGFRPDGLSQAEIDIARLEAHNQDRRTRNNLFATGFRNASIQNDRARTRANFAGSRAALGRNSGIEVSLGAIDQKFDQQLSDAASQLAVDQNSADISFTNALRNIVASRAKKQDEAKALQDKRNQNLNDTLLELKLSDALKNKENTNPIDDQNKVDEAARLYGIASTLQRQLDLELSKEQPDEAKIAELTGQLARAKIEIKRIGIIL